MRDTNTPNRVTCISQGNSARQRMLAISHNRTAAAQLIGQACLLLERESGLSAERIAAQIKPYIRRVLVEVGR